MLARRAAVAAAGLWDPIYQLCVEDADFCMRVKQKGFRCYFAHRARLWHMVAQSAGGYKPSRTFHSGRSTAIFVRRYAGLRQWTTSLLFIAAARPAAFLRELRRGNQAAVVAKYRGFAEGFRVRMTPPPPWDGVGEPEGSLVR
jgi:GT2 family glycosyltransferase